MDRFYRTSLKAIRNSLNLNKEYIIEKLKLIVNDSRYDERCARLAIHFAKIGVVFEKLRDLFNWPIDFFLEHHNDFGHYRQQRDEIKRRWSEANVNSTTPSV